MWIISCCWTFMLLWIRYFNLIFKKIYFNGFWEEARCEWNKRIKISRNSRKIIARLSGQKRHWQYWLGKRSTVSRKTPIIYYHPTHRSSSSSIAATKIHSSSINWQISVRLAFMHKLLCSSFSSPCCLVYF